MLGGQSPNVELQADKMVNFERFQRQLQCASPEPDLDGNRGGLSLMRLAPPAKQSLENMCAWAETNCAHWARCKNVLADLKLGEYDKLCTRHFRQAAGALSGCLLTPARWCSCRPHSLCITSARAWSRGCIMCRWCTIWRILTR